MSKRRKDYFNEHPVRILRYSMKNIWMLIFPLLRGVSVLKFDPAGIYAWIQGAWMDILVLGVILMFGLIQWFFARIYVEGEAIVYKQGVVAVRTTRIPFSRVSVGTSETPFYYVFPLRAETVRLDTRSGFFKSADLKLLVKKNVGTELLSHIPTVDDENRIMDLPRPTALSVILFSAFFSSGFSGAVYIAIFFFKGGSIAKELISMALSRVTETTERISEKLLLHVPQAAIAMGSVFLAAWLLSFLVNLARYAFFRVTADDDCISVACGLTNRRRYQIRRAHINYTDLRQNLIMKIKSIATVNISCAGYGSDSQKHPLLHPLINEKDLGTGLRRMGITPLRKMEYVPRRTSWLSYAGIPSCMVGLVFLLYHFSDKLIQRLSGIPELLELLPGFAEAAGFLTLMMAIPCVWLVIVKTVAMFTSGISVSGERIVMRCTKWTAFHTIIAGKGDAVRVDVYQTIFQRPWRKCNVVIWFSGEGKSRYMVRSLTLAQGREIEELIKN